MKPIGMSRPSCEWRSKASSRTFRSNVSKTIINSLNHATEPLSS
ncbi:MAG: hypothetical protein ACTS43_01925 [Candidatus Hodgkinia cicadicola]